jgi:hypothetical protein
MQLPDITRFVAFVAAILAVGAGLGVYFAGCP